MKFENVKVGVFLMLFTAGSLFPLWSEEISYFRKIRIDQSERIQGEYPLAERDADKVNSYKIFTMDDGRISRIEYHRSGTSLADPLLGVPVIQFTYNGSYVRRTYLDSRGKEVPDDQGIYSVRLKKNSAGAVTASFHYDRYGNLMADRNGIASIMWDVDKNNRKVSALFFDPKGNRVSNGKGVYELKYLYDDRGNLSMIMELDERGIPIDGPAAVRREWDDKGNLIRESWLNSREAAVLNPEGVSSIAYHWDDNGNKLLRVNFDEKGNLTADSNHVVQYRWFYDDFGNRIREEHYDANGNLAYDARGVAVYRWIHYPQGNELEQNNLDTSNWS